MESRGWDVSCHTFQDSAKTLISFRDRASRRVIGVWLVGGVESTGFCHARLASGGLHHAASQPASLGLLRVSTLQPKDALPFDF